VDLASARLNGYTESGSTIYALTYDRLKLDTGTASLGLRTSVALERDYGSLVPQLRLEYQHDFQRTGTASMRYADVLASPVYRANVGDLARNHGLLGIGVGMKRNSGLSLRLEYQNLFDSGTKSNQSIQFNLEYPFNP
jgi:outer membrane autotransporter protein